MSDPTISFSRGLAAIPRRFERSFATFCSVLTVLLYCADASATPIAPTSYTSTPAEGTAQGGAVDYFDDSFTQLIDGIYGQNYWKADTGNGPAFEWVGWRVADPEITFQFANPVTIDRVGIDFNRTEPTGLIYLPTTVTIGGTEFTLAPDALPQSTRGTLYFDGSWTGTTLTVSLADNDPSRWILVDEIKFCGSPAAVPEPTAFALAGVGLCLLALCRRLLASRH